MMAHRRTTRAQDADFVSRLMADLRRDWKPGAPCQSAHAGHDLPSTTILSIEPAVRPINPNDRIARLADGSSCHASRLRSVKP